ncbi:MAG: hypothetical protein R3244_12375, partial [Thermoanaerobaculia bacterium]|nr:hypothetical protein [Thermoanaerobaculia bacterium]
MKRRFDGTVRSRRITPPEFFFDRRKFLAGLGAAAVLPTIGAPIVRGEEPEKLGKLTPPLERPGLFPPDRNAAYDLPAAIADRLTPRETAASHNNFYEFLPGRGGPVWQHTDD